MSKKLKMASEFEMATTTIPIPQMVNFIFSTLHCGNCFLEPLHHKP